jgi:hypothetical protein
VFPVKQRHVDITGRPIDIDRDSAAATLRSPCPSAVDQLGLLPRHELPRAETVELSGFLT